MELKYDLNKDGTEEVITCAVWKRSLMNCELPTPNGGFQDIRGCSRIGVVATRSNQYHDIVCGVDTVYTEDNQWVIRIENCGVNECRLNQR